MFQNEPNGPDRPVTSLVFIISINRRALFQKTPNVSGTTQKTGTENENNDALSKKQEILFFFVSFDFEKTRNK